MRFPAWLALAMICAGTSASAEMERLARACDAGLCFFWWPKLDPIAGWQQDRDQSIRYSSSRMPHRSRPETVAPSSR
ncbi:MAG: hypothetical protein R3F35_24565 [Myxococcota bacterium]